MVDKLLAVLDELAEPDREFLRVVEWTLPRGILTRRQASRLRDLYHGIFAEEAT